MKTISIFRLSLCVAIIAVGGNILVSNTLAERAEPEKSAPELVLQTGHSKAVAAIVYGPNNQWAATASLDYTIKIWEAETGRELRALTGHTGGIKALACSPNGKLLASGGNDKTLKIWEVESGKEINSIAVPDGSIEAVTFGHDGQSVAAGLSSGSIIIRDVTSGREMSKFAEHTGAVTALAFSRDGRFLASGSTDKSVVTWDLIKGQRSKISNGHTDKIEALEFSPDGESLASGSRDTTVRLWKTSSGREIAVFKGHTAGILAVNFGAAGELNSVDTSRVVKRWNLAGNTEPVSVSAKIEMANVEAAESGSFSSDGKFLAVGNGDRTAALFDAASGELVTTLENHTTGYWGVAFSSDRRWLASGSFDNTVKLWDLHTGQALSPLAGHAGYVTAVVFHPDNRRVISASLDHTIRIWDANSRRSLFELKGHNNSIGSIAVGAAGDMLVSGSADNTVGLWNMETGMQTGSLTGHSGEVISVAISRDAKTIASASMDRTIKLWDAAAKTQLRNLGGDNGEVDAVAFSPDGQLLASGGADKMVRIWEVATGRLLHSMPGHTGKINTVFFSPDGKQIATGSQDKTVRIWNVADAKNSRVMAGHAGAVYGLSFTNDGRWLATGSDDGSIIVWKKETGDRLSTLVSLKNSDDWLVVTSKGFFDGSPNAWDQLLWRFGNDTFNFRPAEIFFDEFWQPGLLADLLDEKQATGADKNISARDRRQPLIRLALADPQQRGRPITERFVKVKLEIEEAAPGQNYKQGSGVRDVRLFRNGSLVRYWAGNIQLKGRSVEVEATIPLVEGENVLTAYAFNNDNIKSSDARLRLKGSQSLGRRGNTYIFTIGVGRYENPEFNLEYVGADAIQFADTLRTTQREIAGSEPVEVVTLLNENATKDNIVKILKRFAGGPSEGPLTQSIKPIEPEDSLILYFSGHGISKSERFYMIPHDLSYRGSKEHLSEEGLQTILDHSVSDLELEEVFRKIDAKNLLFIIDACNSGQALEAEEKRRGPMNSKGLGQLAYEKGMYILTASQSAELAYVSQAYKRSYLNHALVEEGLKFPVADNNPADGKLVLREWLDYATNRVPLMRQEAIKALEKKDQAKKLEEVGPMLVGEQRPRVFYRRQLEPKQMIVARFNKSRQ